MFRFTIYKNSILATICSLFGTAFIAMALLSMINGDLEILSGIIVIAVGIGLVILAGEISQWKERRKKAKAAQKAAAAAGNPAAAPRPASPVRPAAPARPAAPRPVKPLGKSLTAAKVLCVLTALCSFYTFYMYSSRDWDLPFDDRLPLVVMAEAILFLMLRAGCSAGKISRLYAPAFLGLAGFNAFVGGSIFLDSAGESELVPVFALKFLCYVMMAVLILAAQYRGGQLPVALWFIPTVLLIIAAVKMASDNYALQLLLSQRPNDGWVPSARPEYPQLYAQLLGAAAMALIGYVSHRLTPGDAADAAPVRQGVQINCPHCYQANSADSLFCEHCGQKLTKPQPAGLCPQCRHQNTADSTFCQNCGHRLR